MVADQSKYIRAYTTVGDDKGKLNAYKNVVNSYQGLLEGKVCPGGVHWFAEKGIGYLYFVYI